MATESSLLLKKNNPGFIPESTFLRFTLHTFFGKTQGKGCDSLTYHSLSATPSTPSPKRWSRNVCWLPSGMFLGFLLDGPNIFHPMREFSRQRVRPGGLRGRGKLTRVGWGGMGGRIRGRMARKREATKQRCKQCRAEILATKMTGRKLLW